ncbi:MAG: N-acetyl sugar amidotransferase [Candidatus Omnitrophica bacterium]|nr:N-acetyl sugar amidotransferase [Candidatus Omnitrophota bacterium]
MAMRYCTRCVYPSASALPLTFDDRGVCSGCRVHEQKPQIDWGRREQMLRELLEEYRSKDGSNYDCIIAVSGGKDSYYQTHLIKEQFGMNPLLVTYNGNNFLEVGWRNLMRMREVFGVDHVICSPSVKTLVTLNRLGFTLMGDMNWHNHCGIYTVPVQIAVTHQIPLVFYGEHGQVDLAGMYSLYDMVELTARFVYEYVKRGFDWTDLVEAGTSDGLTPQDMLWARYPSDQEIARVGVRGIFLGNYVEWDANRHVKLVMERYGWEPSPEPFDRTYRKFSNLDDMHENGAHDYLKYIKFGYGRATDHACKDIRAGYMMREEGIEMVRKYDHVKPRDLKRWLEYVGMTEEEFDRIADTFRDPRVWRKDADGRWAKDNIWDQHPEAVAR